MRRRVVSFAGNYVKYITLPALVIVISYLVYGLHKTKQLEGWWWLLIVVCLVLYFLILTVVILLKFLNSSILLSDLVFDDQKVTFYTQTNKIREFYYNEFVDVGMYYRLTESDVMVGMMFLSKKKLTNEQKDYIKNGKRKKNEWERSGLPAYEEGVIEIAYNPDNFRDLRDHLSEPLRSQLIEEENRCITEYKAYLKRKRDFLSWSRDGRKDLKK